MGNCLPCHARVPTARLEGMVQDASGAAVPTAKVSVVNNRTQARADTLVSPEGRFVFPSLQPSVYPHDRGHRTGLDLSGLTKKRHSKRLALVYDTFWT